MAHSSVSMGGLLSIEAAERLCRRDANPIVASHRCSLAVACLSRFRNLPRLMLTVYALLVEYTKRALSRRMNHPV